MKQFVSFLLSCFFLINNFQLKAQVSLTSGNSTETPNEYYLQVKQFDEFLNRFNYKTDWKGNLMTGDFASKYPRAKYLSYLFNQDDPRIKTPDDSSYLKQVQQFTSEVTAADSQQYISLYSGQVKAHALVNVNYMGKTRACIVTLIPEVLNDRSAKWVISDVEASFFIGFSDSLKANFIAPNSHETNFINLKKIENISNPIYFYPQPMASNPTMLFLTEMACDRIIINYIERVSLQISFSNWVITVEEFIRSDYNSGWLISQVTTKTKE